MITDEERRQIWKAQPREARKLLINGAFEALIDTEDLSTENAIQRIIDTFGCDHYEVIKALVNIQK